MIQHANKQHPTSTLNVVYENCLKLFNTNSCVQYDHLLAYDLYGNFVIKISFSSP